MSQPDLFSADGLSAVRSLCEMLGYGPTLRRERFEVWTGERELYPDVVCFAHGDRHDMATAVIVAGVADGDIRRTLHLDAARALATPLAVFRSLDSWELWRVSHDVSPKGHDMRAERLPFAPDDPAILRFLQPRTLLAAKRQERQLPLFDLDVELLQRARITVGDSLQARVREAMSDLLPDRGRVTRQTAEEVARLSVQALSALAVRDKLLPGRPLGAAIAWLTEHHAMDTAGDDVFARVEDLATDIGQGVNFAGLDATILGDVYENAILEPARRSELGAFYTPPTLARRMLATLPIEEIAPTERRAIDPTCGSGSLLLAVNDRLQAAMLDVEDDRERHDRARTLLFGADRDPFAVEIARLGLLLGALPYGNGYQVEQRDALQDHVASPARIVVANPPWRFARSDGTREQLATRFLQRLVGFLQPGGLLACVLPLTWLTDDTGRPSREWLREHVDVLEVWRLPERVFPAAEQAACVVFARATPPVEPRRIAFRYFSRDVLKRSRNFSSPDFVLVVRDEAGSDPLIADPLKDVSALQTGVRIRDVARVFNGVPVTRIADVARQGGDHLLLAGYGDVDELASVEPHHLIPVQYPEGFWRSETADPSRYLVKKVLVSATRRVDNPWRLKVLDDPLAIIPRNQMHAVVPLDGSDRMRRVLLAVLGSGVASAWVDPRAGSRNVHHNVVAEIPIPRAAHWDQLADAAERVLQAAHGERHVALAAMEQVVWDAFALTDADRRLLRQLLGGKRAPEGVVRIAAVPHVDATEDTDITVNVATVLDVDEHRVRLHVPGVTDKKGSWIPIPPELPGWALRPGAGLEVHGLADGLEHAKWRPQAAAHASVDELFNSLSRS